MSRCLKLLSLLGITLLAFRLTARQPEVEWYKTYGTEGAEEGYTALETPEGGFVISGWTASAEDMNVYMVKTTAEGDTLWTRVIGGASVDQGLQMCTAPDGGFVVAGKSASFSMEEVDGFDTDWFDAYLLKVDKDGNLLWEKAYGTEAMDQAFSVCQAQDGGYLIAGSSNDDVYLVKADENGDSLWARTYGGEGMDWGGGISPTADGGYIVSGFTSSWGQGNLDLYFLKINQAGDTSWTRTYGTPQMDRGVIRQLPDSGYLAVASTGDMQTGQIDIWVLRMDSKGDTLWTSIMAAEGAEFPFDFSLLSDGGCVIAAMSDLGGQDNVDAYLVRLDAEGNVLWDKALGGEAFDGAYCVAQTSDGGFIMTGWNSSEGAGLKDAYLVKLGPEGDD